MNLANLGRLLLPAACLALTACAPMQKSLSSQDKEAIKDVHVQVIVPQETFTFTAQTPGVSAALGGGLLGALIDSSVQKSRQGDMRASIQPVLDELLDADYRVEAAEALRDLKGDFPLHVGRTEVVAVVPDFDEQKALLAAKKPGQAYLRLLVHYNLDLSTKALVTRTQLTMWQPGATEASYMHSVVYVGTPDAAAKAIDSVRRQMRESIAQTIKVAKLDIDNPADKGTHPTQSFTVHTQGRDWPLKGEVLGGDAQRVQVRAADGALFSLKK